MLLQCKGLGVWTWSLSMVFCLFGSAAPFCVMAQSTLRITSPTEGAIVNAGQALTVTVEASPANAFEGIVIITPLGFSQVLQRPPYEFTLLIPRDVTPRREGYVITADGVTGPGQGATSNPVRIVVERADIPEILLPGNYSLNSGFYPSSTPAQPYHLRLSKVGFEERLYVMGIFSGRKQVDLSESRYVKYSSDNLRVAKVNEIGTVHATGIGSAKITITYRSKFVIVPVTVGGEP
jgi:hypothetical protein